MNNSGPIVLVDDDDDDIELLKRILEKLNVRNEIRSFTSSERALDYMRSTDESPFICICDINMPIMNGLELKERINNDPSQKLRSIPFVILSTAANSDEIINAYKFSVQGYFVKGQTYDKLQDSMFRIIQYWSACCHPNNLC